MEIIRTYFPRPVSVFLFFALVSPLFADTITLKSGRRLEGKIEYQDGNAVRIRTTNGLRVVNRNLIRKLVYGPWNPDRAPRTEAAPREPAPRRFDDNRTERRQWWLFQRRSEDVVPDLPRREEPPPRAPVFERREVVPRDPAPVTREPLKEIFKPRARDPETNELVDRFYWRLGVANGDYNPFLETSLARYKEFLFLYREFFRRDEVVREYELRQPWDNKNFTAFPVSLRLFLPHSYIAAEYYRTKNSPGFSTTSVLFGTGGSGLLSENTEFENVRVDRLFRFRENLRGGVHLVDREDLKAGVYGGWTRMRIFARLDSIGFRKSFTQDPSGTPTLFDFSSATHRESNTAVRGPSGGVELSYTAPFDVEFWLRTGAYQLTGDYSSTIQEQILTASSFLYKVTHDWAFTENRHEGNITISGQEFALGARFPAGAVRSLVFELSGESFTTKHENTRAWEYGLRRLAGTEYQFTPVYQDRDEVVELYLLSNLLSDHLKASDSIWYASLGMEVRY